MLLVRSFGSRAFERTKRRRRPFFVFSFFFLPFWPCVLGVLDTALTPTGHTGHWTNIAQICWPRFTIGACQRLNAWPPSVPIRFSDHLFTQLY